MWYKNNSTAMITELIFWSDYYSSIISPFYDYSTGVTADTYRTSPIVSRDINSDGIVEIPLDASFDDCPNAIIPVNWKTYKNTVLIHTCYSLVNAKDGYIIVIPDNKFNGLSIKYDETNCVLSISEKSKKQAQYEIKTVKKSVYDKEKSHYSNYTKVFENAANVCLVKVKGEEINVKTIADAIVEY